MGERWAAARWRWRQAFARLRESDAPVMLVAVAVTVGFTVGLLVGRGGIGPESAPPGNDRAQLARGHDRPAGHAGSSRDAAPTRLDRCRTAYAAEAAPLETVGPALAQWQVHVGAMNKLVLGVITLEEAQAYWDRTRVGAFRKLARFAEAQRDLAQDGARCPDPVGQMPDALRGCAAAVGARHRELDRAAVALDTWRTHVQHMEMLRRGEMTPESATQAWLDSWQEGLEEIRAYRSAARASHRAGPACDT